MTLHCEIPESAKTQENRVNLSGLSFLLKITEDRAREGTMLKICRDCPRSCKNYYVTGLTKFECHRRGLIWINTDIR